MPKISAATVREHREHVQAALIDAAERILRESGPGSLTAGAVSAEAGIARNSIYRYVTSVDDLRGLVLAKHLPQWRDAVSAALDGVTDPRAQVAVWTRANLEQAAATGHGWLMGVARGIELPEHATEALDAVHEGADALTAAVGELAPQRADLAVDVIRGMVDAGFRRLDAGDDPEPLIDAVVGAVLAALDSLAAGSVPEQVG